MSYLDDERNGVWIKDLQVFVLRGFFLLKFYFSLSKPKFPV